MGNRFSKRQRRAAYAGLLAVVLAMSAGMGAAFAQDDDDEDVPLDTKILRRFMKEMGFKRSEDVGIEYRERAPLVVPPSRNLPPPQSEGSVARNPNWPKDPDVARRNEASAAEKAKLRRSADAAQDEARPLRPDELEKGRRRWHRNRQHRKHPPDRRGCRAPAAPIPDGHRRQEHAGCVLFVDRAAEAGKRAVQWRTAAREHDGSAGRLSNALTQPSVRHIA